MASFLVQRWRRQPSGQVEVDWNHPLAPTAGFVIVGQQMLSPFYRLRLGQSGDGLTGKVTAGGSAFSANGIYAVNSITTAFPVVPTGRGMTVAAIARWASPAAGAPFLWVTTAFPSAGMWWDTTAAQWTIASRLNGGSARFAFGSAGSNNDGRVYAASHDGVTTAGGCVAYANGQALTVTNTVAGSGSPDTLQGQSMRLAGADGSGIGWLGSIEFLLVDGVRRSAAATAELSSAPYQILRPARPIIYSLPGGGIPVLSAATVTEIGANSVRPRVTITI